MFVKIAMTNHGPNNITEKDTIIIYEFMRGPVASLFIGNIAVNQTANFLFAGKELFLTEEDQLISRCFYIVHLSNRLIDNYPNNDTTCFTVIQQGDTAVRVTEHSFADNMIKLFPNPVSDYVHINLDNSIIVSNTIRVTVYDVLGRQMQLFENNYSKTEEHYKNKINLSNLHDGIYYLHIDGIKYRYSQMIVKQ